MPVPGVVGGGRHGASPVLLSLALCSACSLPPLSSWHAVPRPRSGVEVGTASWYGPGFHGFRTSSGEIYDQNDWTAAHQTLPLGTRVMVTNLDNDRSVEVRINDRGPFAKGRIIDLSYAAARELEIVDPGTAEVRVAVLDDGSGRSKTVAYAVQVGAFQDPLRATALKQDLGSHGDVYLSPVRTPDQLFYRVRLGPYGRREEAVARARKLSRSGVPAVIVEEVR